MIDPVRRTRLLWASAVVVLAVASGAAAWLSSTRVSQPNVVLVLVDDMGWTDSSVYGSEYYRTPNLERLAQRGMRFDRAYAPSATCAPSRAAILTGKYPARLKMTAITGGRPRGRKQRPKAAAAPWKRVIPPRTRPELPLQEYTIAEALRDAGYRTGLIGKWHLGSHGSVPEQHGFGVSVGGARTGSTPSYHAPYGIASLRDGPAGEYLTDRLTEEALAFIDANRDGPFFLTLWHYAVHAPWGHKREITVQWRGRRDPTGRHGNPIMGSMLQSVDDGLGRILDKLDALGIADETIVIFTSDNGGSTTARGPGNRPPTSNSPLRSGKGAFYEGGIRVPCVVAWPGVVPPGSVSDEVVSSIDFYPTLLQATGLAARAGQILDGASLVPVLERTGRLDRDALFWHRPHYGRQTRMPPGTAVLSGSWKLMRFYGEGAMGRNAYRLYDLHADPGERKNLAESMPTKVAALDALIEKHLLATSADLPRPNPNWEPSARQPWTSPRAP